MRRLSSALCVLFLIALTACFGQSRPLSEIYESINNADRLFIVETTRIREDEENSIITRESVINRSGGFLSINSDTTGGHAGISHTQAMYLYPEGENFKQVTVKGLEGSQQEIKPISLVSDFLNLTSFFEFTSDFRTRESGILSSYFSSDSEPLFPFLRPLFEYHGTNFNPAKANQRIDFSIHVNYFRVTSILFDLSEVFGSEEFTHVIFFNETQRSFREPIFNRPEEKPKPPVVEPPIDEENPVFINGFPQLRYNPEEVFVKYIDLGKHGNGGMGEAMYIKIGDIDILVDAGGGGQSGIGLRAIRETLEPLVSNNTLDFIILTHDDADHHGNMNAIASLFPATIFIYPVVDTSPTSTGRSRVSPSNFQLSCSIIDVVNSRSAACQRVYELAPDVIITFYDTGFHAGTNKNLSSAIFVLDAFGTRFLFNGDADGAAERVWTELVGITEIFKMVHHGTSDGGAHPGNRYQTFLNQQPEIVIITNGDRLLNNNGHPHASAINNAYRANPNTQIFATTGGGFDCWRWIGANDNCAGDRNADRNGTITVTATINGYTVSSANGLIELSQTRFWAEHPSRTFWHNFPSPFIRATGRG